MKPLALIAATLLQSVGMALGTLAVIGDFGKSLIITLLSSALTGVFLLVSTSMNNRATRENRERITQVSQQLTDAKTVLDATAPAVEHAQKTLDLVAQQGASLSQSKYVGPDRRKDDPT